MLGIIFLSLMAFFSLPKTCFWYQKVWALSLGSLLSITHLFMSGGSYMMINSYISQDSMSTMLITLSLWISLMMIIASHNSVKISNNNRNLFMNFLLALNFILIISFSCSNTLLFYFMFEASLIPTLGLILGWGYQPERLQAGMYMMIYTVAASLPLLVSIVWSLQELSCSSMLLVGLIRKEISISALPWIWEIFILLVFGAFLVKLPMFMVHLWLPKAHVEAPVAGSMVLAAILLKLGGYGILRFYQYFNFYPCGMFAFIFALSIWGGVVTSMICFRQIDLKSLIAYSSIGHMSLMLAGAFSNSSWGWSGSLVMMISHGFCSSALFALANYSYEKVHTRSLFLSKGMLMFIPAFSLWWFMFCVMNMAAPPSINLLGEIMIFPCSIFSSSYYVLSIGLMSFLSALYSMYLFSCTQHGGSPKFMKPFNVLKPSSYMLFILHWIPGNLLILKPELVFMWL